MRVDRAALLVLALLAGCNSAEKGRDARWGSSELGWAEVARAGAPTVMGEVTAAQGVAGQGVAGSGEPASEASEANGNASSAPDISQAPVGVADPDAEGAAFPPVKTRLRAVEPGGSPIFDPNAVYFLGITVERSDEYTLSIAPVEDASDSVGAFGYFNKAWIRPGDGHLLYQSNNYGDPVRDFVRDPIPLPAPVDLNNPLDYPFHYGEQTFASNLPCDPGEVVQTAQRYNLVAPDGTLYHSCSYSEGIMLDPNAGDTKKWYDAAGNLVYGGDLWLMSLGAGGRALGQRADALVVFEFQGGAELGSIELEGQVVVAARARQDGFSVVTKAEGSDERSWLDLDASGAIVARGAQAPLPQGLYYVVSGNQWANGAAAIDGYGRLYEFAAEEASDLVVVVRRPRDPAASDIPYRTAAAIESSDPAMLMVDDAYFITGG